jgi:flagellar hook-associated protein 1 FlgK
MSLTLSLRTALSGLTAAQAALQVTSDNIANASTPGYTRKTVDLESRRVVGQGAGVQTGEIGREVDQFIISQLREQRSIVGEYTVRDRFLQQIQSLFGTPENNRTIPNEINELKNAFEKLAVTPEFSANAVDVVNSARQLVSLFNDFSTTAQDLRLDADKEIERLVGIVDGKLENIAELNAQIARATSLQQSTAALEDERDRLLAEVSEFIDIRVFPRTDGTVDVYSGSSRLLVSGGIAKDLTHTAATQVSASIAYVDPNDSTYPGAITGIFLDGTAAGDDITTEIASGSLKALIDMRDLELPNLQSELDRLSQSLANEINAVHNTGTAYPPPAILTGSQSFASADVFSATGSVRVAVIDQSDGTVVETLDIALGALTTVGAVVAAINGMTNANAALDSAGKLVVNATTSGYGIAINEMTSAVTVVGAETRGLSHYFGLNDLFETNVSTSQYDNFSTGQISSSTTDLGIAGTLSFAANGVATTVAYVATDSLDEIATNINANATLAGANIVATVVDDGSGRRLFIQDEDQNNFIVTDSGSFLSTTRTTSNPTSASIVFAVRSDIISDPQRVSRAELSSAGALAAGDIGITPGDASIATDIAGAMNADVTFAATGGFSATTTTFARYASSILSVQATIAADTENQLDFNKSFLSSLDARNSTISGVNVDEELANLVILEQAYNASARVLTTAADMLDELMNVVR